MLRPMGGVLVLALLGSSLYAQSDRFGVDPRVELMSIIFRLAGSNEYTQCRIPSYNAAIDTYFAPFRDHEAIRLARELRANDSVSFDAVMSMAVHVKDIETLAERVPFDRAIKLDKRWHGVKARRFLEAARKFVADSSFPAFLKSQQQLYSTTDTRLRAFVAANADLPWFDRFFGARQHAPFIVAPGMANGGSSYGASIILDSGVEEIYAIPGASKMDAEGLPEFSPSWASTLVHEFAHSYVGPLIDKFDTQLNSSGERLFNAVAAEMRGQAYGSGKTVLNESMVRAATARYFFEHEGTEAATREVNYERGRAFLWTGELLAVFGEYARNRDRYPTMESFMPQVVTFFDGVSARVDQMIREYDQARPKIASMTIANGEKDVDPAIKEIVVRFDRTMRTGSYSVARTSAIETPKMGKVAFDSTGRVFTIPVTLEADKEYAFSLNWPGGGSFQTPDGVLLKPVEVKFRTRANP